MLFLMGPGKGIVAQCISGIPFITNIQVYNLRSVYLILKLSIAICSGIVMIPNSLIPKYFIYLSSSMYDPEGRF